MDLTINLMEEKEKKKVYRLEYKEKTVYVFVTFVISDGSWVWYITRSRDVSKELQLQSWNRPKQWLMLYAEAYNFAVNKLQTISEEK